MKTNRETHQILLALILLALAVSLASCAPARFNPIEILKSAYDRLNAGDVDGYMKYIADDAIIEDSSGRFQGAEAIRADVVSSVLPGKHRFELSDLRRKGNVVTYTIDIYEGDPSRHVATALSIAVLKNGLIIFDGDDFFYRFECDQDPSQAFCPTK